MIDKRVRYQPICCGDKLMKAKKPRGFSSRYCYSLILILSVIILISLYSVGLFSYLLEEDFATFKYPLEIEDADDLVEKIDASLQSASPRVLNYTTIKEAFDRIKVSDSRWSNVKPIAQFTDLSFLINVRTECSQQWNNLNHNAVTVIIVVKSAVNNYARRSAIRGSWYLNGTSDFVSYKTVFMVGACHEMNPIPSSVAKKNGYWSAKDCNERITKESTIYGDIVQSSGIDSYYNNTVKTYMTLRWLSERCQSDFVLFIDDDYVLEVDNLIDYMIDISFKRSLSMDVGISIFRDPASSRSVIQQDTVGRQANYRASNQTKTIESLLDLSKDYLYAGFLRDYVHPFRILMTKWYVTRQEYAYNKYPRFITGGAMLMTHKTVRRMHHVSYFTNSFKFDDVYVGILAKKLGIVPIHSDSFMCTVDDYLDANPIRPDSTSCIGVHDIEPADLLKLWQTRKQTAIDDSKETNRPEIV